MRNIYIHIDQGSKIIERHKNADIVYREVREFMRDYDENDRKHGLPFAVYCAIEDAFLMGVSVGYKVANDEKNPSRPPKINLK